MRQLLQNLISNALKFQRKNASPCVKIYTGQINSASVQILVEDNGIGFPESEAERIFQPFQRLVGRNEYEGSGMGLAICRKIVERHNGSLAARSRPGFGSTFTITLPVRQGSSIQEDQFQTDTFVMGLKGESDRDEK
jgi:signal transduction histidine kinase